MKLKKFIYSIFILLFISGILFGAYKIYENFYEYSDGENSYDNLNQYIEQPENTGNKSFPDIDFSALSSINSDIVGWIYIEDTEINYPVVQTDNNTYYLKHLFDKRYNKLGCIFLDSGNAPDFSDKNSIVYGHNMKDGAMFCDLTKYKEQSFYDSHSEAFLLTPNKNYEIEWFAGYVASTSDYAWQIDFSSDEDYQKWLMNTTEKSCFTSDLKPLKTDKIITLSTCTYDFNDARFVLFGVIKDI